MLGVLALVLQISITAPVAVPSPAVGPDLCGRGPAAGESRPVLLRLVDVVVRWVHGTHAAPAPCASARPATVPVPAHRAVSLALVRRSTSCDDDDDRDSSKDDQHTLPDWAPPYSSLWIPEPEIQLAAFPMGPECDDSLASSLSGGAELALAPRSLSGLLGL